LSFVSARTRRRVLFTAVSALLPLLGLVPAHAVTRTAADIVYPRGDAVFYGSPGSPLATPVVGIASVPAGGGYWVVDRTGHVSAYGSATFYGESANPWPPSAVGIAATTAGDGYWILRSTGYVEAHGLAPFYPSTWDPDAVAIATSPTGGGYWVASKTGAVHPAGVVESYGQVPGNLDSPIVAIASTATGRGYWLLSQDGGVWSFGDAVYYGSGTATGKTFTAMVARPGGGGYWLIAKDGTIANFGSAAAFSKVVSGYAAVAGAPTPTGSGLWVTTTGLPVGAIQGTVKDTAGAPLAGICVRATNQSTQASFNGTAGANGVYRLSDVVSGTYTVDFRDCAAGVYLPQWYNGASTEADATPVTVSTNTTTFGIGAALVRGGEVTGAVHDPAGNGTTACVSVVNTATGEAVYTQTTVTGSYRAGPLVGGQYAVHFRDCSGRDLLPQTWPQAEFDNAGLPVIVPASTSVPGINAVLKAPGSVSGVVTNESGQPLPNICVDARDPRHRVPEEGGPFTAFAMTTVTGYYRMASLETADYVVGFADCNTGAYARETYNNVFDDAKATLVHVNAGRNTPAINAALVPVATISGAVTAGGAGLDDCLVGAYRGTSPTLTEYGWTTAGQYSIHNLAPGTYSLRFSCYGDSYAPQWYGGSPTRSGSTTITLAKGQHLAGANASLDPAGSVSGVVTLPGGAAADDVCVRAFDADGQVSGAATTVTGFYRVAGLSTQSYQLKFTPCLPGTQPAAEWFNNKANRVASDPVPVTAGAETPNVNARLDAAGAIAGVLTEPTGAPAQGMCVSVVDTGGNVAETVGATITGYYRVDRLHGGLYKLQFQDCDDPIAGDHAPVWYSSQPSQSTATVVGVQPSTVTTADQQVDLRIASAPTNVTAAPADRQATVSWTAPASPGASPITSYEVTAWSGGWPVKTVVVPASQTSADVPGLVNGQQYRFRVSATNAWGLGMMSAVSNTAVPYLAAVLTVPATTASPVVATFNGDVKGVTLANFVLRATGTTANLSAALTCRDGSSAVVSCSTGPVRSASLQLSSPLTGGTSYTAVVNPGGVTPSRDLGGSVVPTTSATFTAAG
jgi:hypothetical protein